MSMSKVLKEKVVQYAINCNPNEGWLCKIKAPIHGPLDEVLIVSPHALCGLLVKARPSEGVIRLLGKRKQIYTYVIAQGPTEYLILDEVENVSF